MTSETNNELFWSNNKLLKCQIIVTQPIIDSWLFMLMYICLCLSPYIAPSPPFPLQYSLYPITASLLLRNSFSCRHNENWQDTLLSTALFPPSLIRAPYLPPLFTHASNNEYIFSSCYFFFTPSSSLIVLSCSSFWLVFCTLLLPLCFVVCTCLPKTV